MAIVPRCASKSFFVRLQGNRDGTIAIIFAILLPVIALLIGGSVDYARYSTIRSDLQSAADAASLAAAKEISLADAKTENLSEVAQAVALKYIASQNQRLADGSPAVTSNVRTNPHEVEVNILYDFTAAFGNAFGIGNKTIEVQSVARLVGAPNICALALEQSEPSAIQIQLLARMTGNDCAVFSNSTSTASVSVQPTAELTASTICSAGGAVGQGSMSPAPYLDCPQFDDPLAARIEPTIGICDYNNHTILNQTVTLTPGVFCGGLQILGLSDVTLEPGVYIITGGLFNVAGLAQLSGNGVSFYLDETSTLLFGPTTTVTLSASENGALAGLLVFGSRQQSSLLSHTILSRGAQNIVGTIYLPSSTLIVDGSANVGSEAAYTAIVARRIVLLNSPNVVLNANYGDTDVPVPEGIKTVGQSARLVK